MRYKIASLAAAAIAFGGVQTASAADMAVKAPALAPPVLYNWTGWYVGINGGYGWNNRTGDSLCTTPVACPRSRLRRSKH